MDVEPGNIDPNIDKDEGKKVKIPEGNKRKTLRDIYKKLFGHNYDQPYFRIHTQDD